MASLVTGRADRMRRRFRQGALLLAAALVAAGVGYGVASIGHATNRSSSVNGSVVHSVNLSNGDKYDDIAEVGGRLIISGQTARPTDALVCNSAVVSASTLALSEVRSGNCADPSLQGERVLPVTSGAQKAPGGGFLTSAVRISVVTPGSPGYRLGPVVLTMPTGGRELQWIYGGGNLWLYHDESGFPTPNGAVLLRISAANGAVLQRLTMPSLYRPILAFDDDGLWIAPSGNSLGAKAVYHLGMQADAIVPVFHLASGRYADWMVAAGHSVWLAVSSDSKTGTLWRLLGNAAKPTLHIGQSPFGEEVQGGASIMVGSASDGLWTVIPTPAGTRQQVIRVSPNSGAPRNVATLSPAYSNADDVEYGFWQAVTLNGSMFLLDPPGQNGFSALYSITPG